MYIKARLFSVVIVLISAFMIYTNWQQLQTEGKYSQKIAAMAPVGIVAGLFLLLFPRYFGKPNSTSEKVIVMIVFVIGLAVGLLNWFLMDPGFFGVH